MTAHPNRPAHLRAVPALTDRHQMAIERGWSVISGDAYRSHVSEDALDRILRVVHADAAVAAVADEVGLNEPTRRVLIDEDGIGIDHCIACQGLHHTGWDRVVVGTGSHAGDAQRGDVHMAFWPCPNVPAGSAQSILWEPLDDVDFAEAIDGGAELMPEVEDDALLVRFRSWIGHPSITATSSGWTQPEGDGAA